MNENYMIRSRTDKMFDGKYLIDRHAVFIGNILDDSTLSISIPLGIPDADIHVSVRKSFESEGGYSESMYITLKDDGSSEIFYCQKFLSRRGDTEEIVFL